MEPISLAFGVLSAITTALGGPSAIISKITGLLAGKDAAAVAGKVVDTATKTFGSTDPEVIKAQIAADQTKLAAFQASVEADTKAYEIEVEDRKDARARDLELRKIVDDKGVPAGANPRANVMLGMAFCSFITIIFLTVWFRSTIPDGVLAILNASVGALLYMIGQAFNFEFGSSRGSSEKSNTISNMADAASRK